MFQHERSCYCLFVEKAEILTHSNKWAMLVKLSDKMHSSQ